MVIIPFAVALSLAMFTGFTLSAAQSLLPITGDLGAQGEGGWLSATLRAAGGTLIAPNTAVRGQQMEMSVGLCRAGN